MRAKSSSDAATNGITSTAWTDFLESIKRAKADLGNPEVLWYRGHPNSRFYLLASLLRYENGIDKEKLLFTNFKKFSDRILKRRDSEWETLFEMQHYGVPTRLLDWSETFGIALFFAATYNQSQHPARTPRYIFSARLRSMPSAGSMKYTWSPETR
jgi:hypothetical protein